jgi:hypothetical protein
MHTLSHAWLPAYQGPRCNLHAGDLQLACVSKVLVTHCMLPGGTDELYSMHAWAPTAVLTKTHERAKPMKILS